MVSPPSTKSNQWPVGVLTEATIWAGLVEALGALAEEALVVLAATALALAGDLAEVVLVA
jgi:hypothetical protein